MFGPGLSTELWSRADPALIAVCLLCAMVLILQDVPTFVKGGLRAETWVAVAAAIFVGSLGLAALVVRVRYA